MEQITGDLIKSQIQSWVKTQLSQNNISIKELPGNLNVCSMTIKRIIRYSDLNFSITTALELVKALGGEIVFEIKKRN